jgi:hypothetical protein
MHNSMASHPDVWSNKYEISAGRDGSLSSHVCRTIHVLTTKVLANNLNNHVISLLIIQSACILSSLEFVIDEPSCIMHLDEMNTFLVG